MSKFMVRWVLYAFAVLLCLGGIVPTAAADTAKSNNYRLEEGVVGGGGLVQSGSNNYSVTESLSDIGNGPTSSTNYNLTAGTKAPDDPRLAFSITGGAASFGNFSASAAATATASFSVLNYTSYGYVVQVIGSAPTNGSKVIPALATATTPTSGTEQFGMNLVANTVPVSLGSNPDQGQFGFGIAAPNYATANKYRFVSGETIASAPKSSGVTNYTISYVTNVTSLTPGGAYTSNQTLVCTGTY